MDLKPLYRDVLTGFEKYNFSERVIRARSGDFEMAAHDLDACKRCNGGLCKTSLNHDCQNWEWHLKLRREKCGDECYPQKMRGYFGLWRKHCGEDDPVFAVHYCPGVTKRQDLIVESMTSIRR